MIVATESNKILILISMDAANKSSNLETTHNHHPQPTVPSTSSQQEDFKGTHNDQGLFINSTSDHEEVVILGKASLLDAGETRSHKAETRTSPPSPLPEASGGIFKMVMEEEEESLRGKLKKHRVEMSGRVWIPEIWGQEDLLKNWIDCTVFDSSLDKTSIMSAREALIHDGTSTSLGLETSTHSC